MCNKCCSLSSFNPRSPCGERLHNTAFPPPHRMFQSTLPVWGATGEYFEIAVKRLAFQSTLPVWGATAQGNAPMGLIDMFQSTLPVWGATLKHIYRGRVLPVSIHAPRVGSDSFDYHSNQSHYGFNPRSPCGERHTRPSRTKRLCQVSIHAPRVGSDIGWRSRRNYP